jgi:uncharacterized protein HemX
MNVWRKVASLLMTLGAGLIGYLLAAQRRPGLQRERQARADDDERIAEIKASMTARKQAVVTEQKKQRDLAKEGASLDEQLAAVGPRVEGLSHDNLSAELHRALGGPADAAAPPGIVKPGGVIKPAS